MWGGLWFLGLNGYLIRRVLFGEGAFKIRDQGWVRVFSGSSKEAFVVMLHHLAPGEKTLFADLLDQ